LRWPDTLDTPGEPRRTIASDHVDILSYYYGGMAVAGFVKAEKGGLGGHRGYRGGEHIDDRDEE